MVLKMPIYYQFILSLFGNFPPWASYRIADYLGGSVAERLQCWNCNPRGLVPP